MATSSAARCARHIANVVNAWWCSSSDQLPSGSLDFVSDQLANGRRSRLLNVLDDFNSECLAAIPDFSLSGLRVNRELEAVMAVRGILSILAECL